MLQGYALCPLNLLIFPTKLSTKSIIAQEDKSMEWIYLLYKGQEIIIVCVTLAFQLINQGKAKCH